MIYLFIIHKWKMRNQTRKMIYKVAWVLTFNQSPLFNVQSLLLEFSIWYPEVWCFGICVYFEQRKTKWLQKLESLSGLVLSPDPLSLPQFPPEVGNRNLNSSPPKQVINLKMSFTTISLSSESSHVIDVLVYTWGTYCYRKAKNRPNEQDFLFSTIIHSP